MKINSIELSWFRGAAHTAELSTGLKNVAIYGSNASGKSSFTDAIEYLVNEGRIEHLAHEYSGRRQEKGVINTHAPQDCAPWIRVSFEGGAHIGSTIASDGTPTFDSDPDGLVEYVQKWQVEHLILRQDEVAAFVKSRKGDKYSVLLPLLGLENLERAAENMAALKQSVEKTGDLAGKRATLRILKDTVSQWLPDLSDKAVLEVLADLAKDYLTEALPTEHDQMIASLTAAIRQRADLLTPDIGRHTLTKGICEEDLPSKLSEMEKAEEGVLAKVDELLDSRIEVLEAAAKYGHQLDPASKEIKCPACGTTIARDGFVEHVQGELYALKDLRTARDHAISCRRTLNSSVGQVLGYARDENLTAWLALDEQMELKEALARLDELHQRSWQGAYSEEDRTALAGAIAVVNDQFKRAAEVIPPSNQKLIDEQQMVEACSKVPEIAKLERDVAAVDRLVGALDDAEPAIRKAIRSRTTAIMQAISPDIQALWAKLHPRELIEDVRLYLPEDADKAIDIGLKFFGVEQPSPLLTLSEGHRNSLGLCIFLALARASGNKERPVLLDDVVSSLDRGHRGNVTQLLLDELTERQVILLTHDREWFQELRVMLPADKWKLLVLRPWVSPEIGIQWSVSEDTFDDARGLIAQSCEAAGNCVRQIMDTNLAIAAEKLQVRVPYARGDRNDQRTCVEFLERIISQAKTSLRKEENGSWQKYDEPIDDWRKAHDWLIARADRASHGGSLVPDELENLMQACEDAWNRFKCPECGGYIWVARQANKELMQCRCGKIQWRYG